LFILWEFESVNTPKYAPPAYEPRRAEHNISVQLITICAVVKSKRAVEKGNVCTKKCRDSGQNDDLCADYLVLCNCKFCLKFCPRVE